MISAEFIAVIVIAYILGNISPSTILAKRRGMDIKHEGSGNAGTTNTLRVLGVHAALITLVVDIGKGVLAVMLARWICPAAVMYCALAAFLGHVFPVFLKFKGGKGVAVAFGVLLAMNWKLALAAFGVVAVVVVLTRRVSPGSIAIAVVFPLLVYWMEPDFFYLSIIMALIVFFKHWSNLMRLSHGEEKPITASWFKKR